MKKTICIILAVLLSLSAFFVTAYAADTKTEKFIDDILASKSLSIAFDDDFFDNEGIPLEDVVANAKIYVNEDGSKDIKVAATAKLWFFNVKLLVSDGEIVAYMPLLTINVTDLLGGSLDLSVYADEIDKMFGILESELFDCLKLKSSGDETTEKYGEVYVEKFVPDIRKVMDLAVKEGLIELPADSELATMTEAEIIEMLKSFGQKGENVLRMFESHATFYYDDEGLVAFDIVLYDAADDDASLNSNDLLPIKAESITTNVPDSAFDKPVSIFDITSLFTMLLGLLFA